MVDTEDCLDQCEGTIADVVKLSDPKNEDGLKPLLKNYETFKFSDLVDLKYPYPITGPPEFNFKLRSRLKYVLISFSTSTFDRIKKVSIYYFIILTRSDLNDSKKIKNISIKLIKID